MDQDFFTNLRTEVMLDIVLRLPIPTIMSCKCVCKPWRDLIKTREFVESHLSRSIPCFALFQPRRISKPYKIIEFADTQNSDQNYCNMVLNFRFPPRTILHSSANGLLFLSNNNARDLFICNPILSEYIKLPLPVEVSVINQVYGFGVSKLSGEYKVVRLFSDRHNRQLNPPRKCEVYSVRRGLWRSVATAGNQLRYAERISLAVFSNGNLHWLVGRSVAQFRRILCFDLETECFRSFSIPHLNHGRICVLRDCLCLCDYKYGDGFVIWLMDKYGDGKSWRKEFIIKVNRPSDLSGDAVPIKVSEDGNILFVSQISSKLYCYSSKTKTI